ncbi:hypothetical protein E2C01_095333 [Portunus trituberculatus]|uniref:Uncharacterized protein n=1 Tax=Portunus trituberculatus TaxID=210409 RepID=A0A5B7K3Y4_PORTR|nr:hypothetical protein [Portunus trituberculatus]
MTSFPRQRDSRDFSPYSSSSEWADEDKTSSSALSEADVEGPAVCSRVDTFHWFEVRGYKGRASCSRVGRCDRV